MENSRLISTRLEDDMRQLHDKLIAYATSGASVRQWSRAAGVDESVVRRLIGGADNIKLTSLIALEKAMPKEVHQEWAQALANVAASQPDILFYERALTDQEILEFLTDPRISQTLEWHSVGVIGEETGRDSPTRVGERMTIVDFRNGEPRCGPSGGNFVWGQMEEGRPFIGSVNKSLDQNTASRMMVSLSSGQPVFRRLSLVWPSSGLIHVNLVTLPSKDRQRAASVSIRMN